MSNVIDNRVLSMEFDNSRFEKNVSTSMSTLDKLKEKLNLSGAAKGLDNVNSIAKKTNLNPLASSVETVTAKFSALEVMAVTALANITNKAVNAGQRMVSALTIDPIKSGFQEYETQMGAIQTILSNTQKEGTNVAKVNAALDELNLYADKTIYNFTEMTRNIGTFTAAGVKLDTSVSAIKGIANLAAASGSTSQQASTAMYQLSQALASGTVKLMDWNSVVNAGMGGQLFQDALKRTSELLGTGAEAAIKAEGSFRESLSTGWLTTEVLTQTLDQFSTAADTEEEYAAAVEKFVKQGYTKEQATEIANVAKTAGEAATKVKTFTQLWNTLKEAAQSGWSQTWRSVIGDFDDAKELMTNISDKVSGMINDSANVRNKVVSGAMDSNYDKLIAKINEAGMETDEFETKVKASLSEAGVDVETLVKEAGSLQKAFQNGSISTDLLKDAVHDLSITTSDLSEVQSGLKLGDASDDVKKIQQALKDLGYDVGEFGDSADGLDGKFGNLTESAIKAFQAAEGLEQTGIVDEATLQRLQETSSSTLDLKENLDDLIDGCDELGGREKVIEGLKNVFEAFMQVIAPIKNAWSEIFPSTTSDQVVGLIDRFKAFTETLAPSDATVKNLGRTFKGLFSILDIGAKAFKTVAGAAVDLVGGLSPLGSTLLEITASIGDQFTALNESIEQNGFFSTISEKISDFAGSLKNALSGIDGFGSGFSVVTGAISKVASFIWGVLEPAISWVKENISGGDIFAGLAGGGIFVAFKKISDLISTIKNGISNLPFFGDKNKKGGLTTGIAKTFATVMNSVNETLAAFTSGVKVASIIAIAIAVTLLSSSLKSIANIKADDIAKSLVTIGAMIKMLSVGFRDLMQTVQISQGKSKGTMKAAASMILMAAALSIMAGAIKKLAGLSLGDIAKGLLALGGGMAMLVTALGKLGGKTVSLRTSVAMLALAEACKILGDAMAKFAGFSWEEIAKGLTGMGGALAELAAALTIMSKVGGGGSTLLSSVGLLIAVQSLYAISENLKRLGDLSWSEIEKGLAAMGFALLEFMTVLSFMSKIGGSGKNILSGLGLLIAAQSLYAISDNLKRLGDLSWDEIKRGLVAMGGALAELGIVTGALGKLTGLSGLIGSLSLVIAAQSLADIASAFSVFVGFSWDEIGRGLAGMGGALAEVGTVTGALGVLAGFSGILGAGSLLIAVQGLGDLASAFTIFAGMTWDEIGRGLAGMGGALTEVGVVTGALGALTGVAGLLGGGSLLLAVQGLGDLADAFKKFGDMSWDEIGHGLGAMGAAMGETALGGLLNTFSGFGANAISEMAAPLGDLADSVKKWSGVTVPDGLGGQLASLAPGIMAFTLDGLGASALATVAAPLGTMADSIRSWANVAVPEDLGTQLQGLASGVKAFTFGGFGADALAQSVEPLASMAASVTAWDGVTISNNLQDGLTGLAEGVTAFTLGGFGANTMSNVVEPLADMATSIAAWDGVTISDNLQDGLTGLAEGVKQFTLGGWGVDTLSSLVEPLGGLATSIAAWDGVTIPSDIETNLTSLANGIGQFTLKGWGADTFATVATGMVDFGTGLQTLSTTVGSMDSIVESFGKLETISDSITDVNFDSLNTIGPQLLTYSQTVSAMDTGSITTSVSAIEKISSMLTELSGSDFSGAENFKITDIAKQLSKYSNHIAEADFSTVGSSISAARTIKNFADTLVGFSADGIASFTISDLAKSISKYSSQVGEINAGAIYSSISAAQKVKSFIESLSGFDGSGVLSFQSAVSQLGSTDMSGINSMSSSMTSALDSMKSSMSSAGTSMMSGLASSISSGASAVSSSATKAASSAVTAVTGMSSSFTAAGRTLMTALATGMSSAGSYCANNVRIALSNAYAATTSYRSAFYSAGAYISSGLAAGMSSALGSVRSIAAQLVSAAAAAVRAKAQIKSPSRVFKKLGAYMGEGLAIGMEKQGSSVYESAASLADSAKSGLGEAISNLYGYINDTLDTTPTISPVLDLSNVTAGVGTLNGMFGGLSVGATAGFAGSLGFAVGQRNQNGTNDDVVSAIEKLGKHIDALESNTTVVGNVTYDDGSNISNAVSDLVRAAKIERRI